jgi:hypothetical protein
LGGHVNEVVGGGEGVASGQRGGRFHLDLGIGGVGSLTGAGGGGGGGDGAGAGGRGALGSGGGPGDGEGEASELPTTGDADAPGQLGLVARAFLANLQTRRAIWTAAIALGVPLGAGEAVVRGTAGGSSTAALSLWRDSGRVRAATTGGGGRTGDGEGHGGRGRGRATARSGRGTKSE